MRYLAAVALLIGALLVVAGPAGAGPRAAQSSCVPRASADRGEAATLKRARKIVNRYASETLANCNGVEGMGVGAADGVDRPDADRREHVIVIYLRDRASKPKRARSIAGVTIRYVVTGPFTPL
jgi:hypothetical protein